MYFHFGLPLEQFKKYFILFCKQSLRNLTEEAIEYYVSEVVFILTKIIFLQINFILTYFWNN